VWQVSNDGVVPAVGQALASGYRMIDTVQGYDNEEGVGRALRSIMGCSTSAERRLCLSWLA
jgi:2,5-diketo-D-gluconate reductase A